MIRVSAIRSKAFGLRTGTAAYVGRWWHVGRWLVFVRLEKPSPPS